MKIRAGYEISYMSAADADDPDAERPFRHARPTC